MPGSRERDDNVHHVKCHLKRCLIIFDLSIVTPEVGKRTGSFINSLVTGSRNSSGA